MHLPLTLTQRKSPALLITVLALMVSACSNQNTRPQQSALLSDEGEIRVPAYIPRGKSGSLDQLMEIRLSSTDDLWQLTRDHFSLTDYYEHPRVIEQRDWYGRYSNYLSKVSEQASKYYFHVLNQVLARGMPAEIALLPIIESAYNPHAVSPGHAVGPWQFLAGTAKHYGVTQNSWYDGRKDIIESTRAALDYLQMLADRYDGDWLLALAAYNAGEGNVDRAISRNQNAGKPTDYWNLQLPGETHKYVPKLLAISAMVQEPNLYGINLFPISNSPYFTVLETDAPVNIRQLAKEAGVNTSELEALNPGFKKPITTPAGAGPDRILVPIEVAEVLRLTLNDSADKAPVDWRRYQVRSGDTLSDLAIRFNTSTQSIKDANNLKSNSLSLGQELMIPGGGPGALPELKLAENRTLQNLTKDTPRYYRVQSGDSLWTIANKHGLSVAQLAKLNKLKPNAPLKVGQSLSLGALKARENENKSSKYRVKSGDTLSQIAEDHKVSVQQIKEWNRLKGNQLRIGQELVLYPASLADADS
ncbi:lytic transglycosylase [Balneatrix alpica]|uniref:lytic transglycosylase n=1 Tax=Balneatrix alpica TaxID=75684 RepID=UPI00273843A3|nr:LysM peptidoglycan-binding domain-containing protein [Balneatrix alpica]